MHWCGYTDVNLANQEKGVEINWTKAVLKPAYIRKLKL